MRLLFVLLGAFIALAGTARATGLTGYACQGWGLTVLAGPSICGTAPSPPASSILLIDTGNAMLINTGNKLLIQ
jgi:hypothetical protein